MKKELVDKMSLSEAVNYALSKIVEQGKSCKKSNGYCAYEIEGNHCVIGWLLDETNEDLMEFEGSLDILIEECGDSVPDLIKDNTYIFEPLQTIHDVANERFFITSLKELDISDVDIDEDLLDKWIEIKKKEFSDEG